MYEEQQIGTRRQKIEFGGPEILRHIPSSGRKMLDNSITVTDVDLRHNAITLLGKLASCSNGPGLRQIRPCFQ